MSKNSPDLRPISQLPLTDRIAKGYDTTRKQINNVIREANTYIDRFSLAVIESLIPQELAFQQASVNLAQVNEGIATLSPEELKQFY